METIMDQIPVLGSDPKKWVIALAAFILSLVLGRFYQAWKSGEGFVGAAKAVWLGTNTKKDKEQP